MKSTNVGALALCCAQVLFLGCGGGDGGGGDSNSLEPTAEGVYGGTLTGSIGDDFQALVLDDGEFWSLYGSDYGSIFYVYGFVQGNGTSKNGTFKSDNVKDFGYSPAIPGNLSAFFNTSTKTMNGTVKSDGASIQFYGGPISGSLYHYETRASLSTVIGRWDTTSSEGGNVLVNILADGTLYLTDNGCHGSGKITPHTSGKNVFTVRVSFGGVPCAMANQTATGIAIAYPLATGQTQVIAAATNSSRKMGISVVGIR